MKCYEIFGKYHKFLKMLEALKDPCGRNINVDKTW